MCFFKKSISLKKSSLLASWALFLLCQPLAADATFYNFPNDTEEQVTPLPMPSRGLPSSNQRALEGADVFITADFIWWRALESGNECAITNPGSYFSPDYVTSPGFIAGLGLNLEQDDWDLYGQYTWLHSKSNLAELSIPEGSTARSLFSLTNIADREGEIITSCQNKWILRYNEVTLDLCRNTLVSRFLSISPSIGMMGNWQKQTYLVYATNPDGDAYLNRLYQKFTGIGIRTGLATQYRLCHGFSLAGNFYLGSLWSCYRITQELSQLYAPLDIQTPQILSTQSLYAFYHTMIPTIDTFLGLKWEKWFDCNQFSLSLQLGWQERIYVNFNQMQSAFSRGSCADFSVSGLDLQLRLGF